MEQQLLSRKVAGNWGYAPKAGGWVCLDYLAKVGGATATPNTNVVAGGTYTLTSDMRVRTGQRQTTELKAFRADT